LKSKYENRGWILRIVGVLKPSAGVVAVFHIIR
jgi:hypothetical protein